MGLRLSTKDAKRLGILPPSAAKKSKHQVAAPCLERMPVDMISFRVEGQPVAQPRYWKGKNGHYIPDDHAIHAYKQMVRLAARQVYQGLPFKGALLVSEVYVFKRPKRLIWTDRPMPREPHTAKPDEDNLSKSLRDALSGILWVDDRQIVGRCEGSGPISKWYAASGESPHVEIEVRSLER